MYHLIDYKCPEWAKSLPYIPKKRVKLGLLPTPLEFWTDHYKEHGINCYIKRDDYSGFLMSGNKVRKLEFLLADAVYNDCNCVITIGGIQSNHCRATAVACKILGIECHIILRVDDKNQDIGLNGNLLIDRFMNANIHLVDTEEFKKGPEQLCNDLKNKLNKKCYIIPIGGTDKIGLWGYIEMFNELLTQIEQSNVKIDDLVISCGTAGTLCGLAIAAYYSKVNIKIYAGFVCSDNISEYNENIDKILSYYNVHNRNHIHLINSFGIGYAQSSTDELKYFIDICNKTGVLLDPVYNGKSFKCFVEYVSNNKDEFINHNVLLVHTGGFFAYYDKLDQLLPLLSNNINCLYE